MSRRNVHSSVWKPSVLHALVATIGMSLPAFALAENLAMTFDDLPLNGTLPPGATENQLVRRVLSILKHHHVPQV